MSSRIVDGNAYVIGGGFNDLTNTNIVEAYDIATDTWDTAKTPMPTPRVEVCTAVVNGKIYAIGGVSHHNSVESVEVYDPDSNEWDMFDDTPGSVLSHGANEFEGHIYVFTGSYAAEPNPSPAVYRYSPALDADRIGISVPEYSREVEKNH